MSLRSDTMPVRVLKNSKWVPIDSHLVNGSDGMFTPAAAASVVAFSPGGSGPLAKVQTSTGSWLSESWPYGALPTPDVSGSTATYGEVLPGVDLKLTATAAGMSEVLVLKTQEAAANPAIATLDLGLAGGTVSLDASKSLRAVAPDGSTVVSSAPLWWDSSVKGSGPSGPAGDGGLRPLDHSASGSEVTLNVGAIAQTPSVTYPVFVDPDWSVGAQAFWFTDRAYPNQSYLNGQYSAGYQSVGNGGGYLSHAFWQFGVGALAHKHILSATFNATQILSYTCTAHPYELWRYGPATAGFTWNQDPGAWDALLDTKSLAYGSSCQPASAVGFNATQGVAYAASTAGSILQLGLKAYNDSDTNTRTHFAQAASLTVNYNTPPNTPSSPVFTSPQRVCGTSSAPVYLNGNQPITLSASVTDPDAGTAVNALFTVLNGSTLAAIASYGAPQEAQGKLSVNIAAGRFAPGYYAWHADAGDGIDLSPGYSPYCYFYVKNSSPALPTITTVSASTGVGLPMRVQFTSASADKVTEFAYWWSAAPATPPSPAVPVTGLSIGSPLPACDAAVGVARTACDDCVSAVGPVHIACADSSGTSPELTVAPVDDISTLWVASYDAAGNVSMDAVGTSSAAGLEVHTASDTTGVSFSAGHGWMTDYLDSPLPTVIPDSNTNSGTALTSEQDLTVGVGTGTGSSQVLGSPPPDTVISLPGYTELARFYNGVSHDSVAESAVSGGYSFEHVEGQIAALVPAGQQQPASTSVLYDCLLPSGHMTSRDSACEGTGVVGVPEGYIWNSVSVVPAGVPSAPLYRCHTTTDHFDSSSSTCEGSTTDLLLGYLAEIVPTTTAGPVVDTTKSFTVSAWLNPSSSVVAGRNYTAVAQSGTVNSGFSLQVDDSGHWRFCLTTQLAAWSSACASSLVTAPTDAWTFVTGIWDATNRQVRLIIGGTSTSAAAVTPHNVPAGDISAAGAVTIGSGVWAHALNNQWNGQIDDPTVFPGVVDSKQLQNLAHQSPPQ